MKNGKQAAWVKPPATSLWHGEDDKEERSSAEESIEPEDGRGPDGGSQPEEGLRHQKSGRPIGSEMERGVVICVNL